MSQWGVYVTGDIDIPVSSGDWEGDFQGLVEDRGVADDFTVTWDESTHRVTLTGN